MQVRLTGQNGKKVPEFAVATCSCTLGLQGLACKAKTERS